MGRSSRWRPRPRRRGRGPLMIAPPRVATVGMSCVIQASSTRSAATPAHGGVEEVGIHRVVVVAPDGESLDLVDTDAELLGEHRLARLWSRRVRALNRSFGDIGALLIAMSALVLAGLPVTRILTSRRRPCSARHPGRW